MESDAQARQMWLLEIGTVTNVIIDLRRSSSFKLQDEGASAPPSSQNYVGLLLSQTLSPELNMSLESSCSSVSSMPKTLSGCLNSK
jgi:hypothetical protein